MLVNTLTCLLGITACYIVYSFNQILANSTELKVINSSRVEELHIEMENKIEKGEGDVSASITKKNKEVKNETSATEPIKKRNQVKLTMKQGLIMNQVIATYALTDVKNSLCKNHTEEFKLGLRALEPWALQMFDSSSKVGSGILYGNTAEYGAYKQCLNIYKNTEYGPIRGRHCSIYVSPTEKLMKTILSFRNVTDQRYEMLKNSVMQGVALMWSVCVPDSCHSDDVLPHFNKSIMDLTEGLNLVVSLKEENCISLENEPQLSTGDYLVISFIGTIVSIVSVATLIDYANEGKSHWFFNSFSAYSNSKRLFSTANADSELECLHGLRYLSICYVVAGHRYIQNMVFPTVNSVEMIDWLQHYFSTLVMGGTVSVDTFFLISSTLLSYHFFRTVTKTNNFNLFYFYVYRNLRILMPLGVVIAIYATLLRHFGTGPSWYDYANSFQMPCQLFWWSTLLHLQSYINPQALCIVQVWHLTNEMLFYYLSPIILIPLWKWPKFGYINFILVYIASIISSFWIAWSYKFDGRMPMTRLLFETKYFQKYYVVPHARASSYIIGLGFGYALFKTRTKRIHINFKVNMLGWSISVLTLISVILSSHIFYMENYKYNKFLSSLYISCSRSIWTLGLIWIIFCCVTGNGGVANLVLSHPVFKILGRITYSIYLLHYMFQSSMQAARKSPDYFSDFTTVYMACSDVVFMTVVGIPFTLCFEYPFIRLATVLLSKPVKTAKIEPEKK